MTSSWSFILQVVVQSASTSREPTVCWIQWYTACAWCPVPVNSVSDIFSLRQHSACHLSGLLQALPLLWPHHSNTLSITASNVLLKLALFLMSKHSILDCSGAIFTTSIRQSSVSCTIRCSSASSSLPVVSSLYVISHSSLSNIWSKVCEWAGMSGQHWCRKTWTACKVEITCSLMSLNSFNCQLWQRKLNVEKAAHEIIWRSVKMHAMYPYSIYFYICLSSFQTA